MAKTATEDKETKDQATKDAEKGDSKKQAQSVDFAEVTEGDAAGAGGSIDILLDMNVPVRVSIGQTEIPVRRLLQLGPGSVLSLDKPIDEPADLYLKDTRFASGSIVEVDGLFAVKINQIFGAEPQKAEAN